MNLDFSEVYIIVKNAFGKYSMYIAVGYIFWSYLMVKFKFSCGLNQIRRTSVYTDYYSINRTVN
jgi:hypothetical protein